jgi:hypothetical protein
VLRAPSGLRRLDTTVTMMTSAWSTLDGFGDSEWFRLLGANKPQMASTGKDGKRGAPGPHQLGGGGVMPTLGDGEQATALLMEAVNVRSVHRGEGGATHLDHMMGGAQGPRRRKRAGGWVGLRSGLLPGWQCRVSNVAATSNTALLSTQYMAAYSSSFAWPSHPWPLRACCLNSLHALQLLLSSIWLFAQAQAASTSRPCEVSQTPSMQGPLGCL